MPHKCAVASHDGMSIFADGLAFDPDKGFLVAASFLGYAMSIKAIWAALMSKQGGIEARMPNDDGTRTLWREDGATYLQVVSPKMPESGTQHVVLVHKRATQLAAAGEDFYVLSPPHVIEIQAQAETLREFGARFGEITTIPVEPHWIPYLWKQGIRQRLIEESAKSWIPSLGFALWRVKAERDPWLTLIEKGIRSGVLQ